MVNMLIWDSGERTGETKNINEGSATEPAQHVGAGTSKWDAAMNNVFSPIRFDTVRWPLI